MFEPQVVVWNIKAKIDDLALGIVNDVNLFSLREIHWTRNRKVWKVEGMVLWPHKGYRVLLPVPDNEVWDSFVLRFKLFAGPQTPRRHFVKLLSQNINNSSYHPDYVILVNGLFCVVLSSVAFFSLSDYGQIVHSSLILKGMRIQSGTFTKINWHKLCSLQPLQSSRYGL